MQVFNYACTSTTSGSRVPLRHPAALPLAERPALSSRRPGAVPSSTAITVPFPRCTVHSVRGPCVRLSPAFRLVPQQSSIGRHVVVTETRPATKTTSTSIHTTIPTHTIRPPNRSCSRCAETPPSPQTIRSPGRRPAAVTPNVRQPPPLAPITCSSSSSHRPPQPLRPLRPLPPLPPAFCRR